MAWPQDAYVGQEVVCVFVDEAQIKSPVFLQNRIVSNAVYRILGITKNCGKVYLQVQPANPLIMWWLIHQFRPIRSTSRGMETLRALLKPENHRIRQDQFDKEPQT